MIDLALRVLLVGLAAWRVSALLSYEDGPFGVFVRFRSVFAPRLDGDALGAWRETLRSECQQLLSCVWCLSIYTAIVGWAVWEVSPVPVAIAAAAAVVVAVERWNRG